MSCTGGASQWAGRAKRVPDREGIRVLKGRVKRVLNSLQLVIKKVGDALFIEEVEYLMN
jgi:hypothetical protein